MPNRKAEPGVWGSCKCGNSIWLDDHWLVRDRHCVTDGHCLSCGDELLVGGHVRPNLQRVAEGMLAEFVASGKIGGEWFGGGEPRLLRRLLATGCETCGGSGYVDTVASLLLSEPGTDNAHYQEPCPDCQPAKEDDDED